MEQVDMKKELKLSITKIETKLVNVRKVKVKLLKQNCVLNQQNIRLKDRLIKYNEIIRVIIDKIKNSNIKQNYM